MDTKAKYLRFHRIFSIHRPRILGKLLIICILSVFNGLHAQNEDKPFLDDFRGTTLITNNGISLVPSFSLGDPALIVDLKFTKGKFSFEPDMRFALEGKPWTFIFWFRYKALEKERFTLRVGAHPALNFRTITIMRNGIQEEILESRRYIAAELAPNYKFTENIGIGMYYLWGHGFDDGVQRTHFIVLNSSFNKLKIWNDFYTNISPQVYHLRQDELKGNYAVGLISIHKEGFPISASALFNKAIETEILPEDDFTWSVSLIYSFP